MATLSPGGRITEEVVAAELKRLSTGWGGEDAGPQRAHDLCTQVLGESPARELDRFDRVQLADVLNVCRASRSMSEAGRELFAASRALKSSVNDADRLKKYLTRFGLSWDRVSKNT